MAFGDVDEYDVRTQPRIPRMDGHWGFDFRYGIDGSGIRHLVQLGVVSLDCEYGSRFTRRRLVSRGIAAVVYRSDSLTRLVVRPIVTFLTLDGCSNARSLRSARRQTEFVPANSGLEPSRPS